MYGFGFLNLKTSFCPPPKHFLSIENYSTLPERDIVTSVVRQLITVKGSCLFIAIIPGVVQALPFSFFAFLFLESFRDLFPINFKNFLSQCVHLGVHKRTDHSTIGYK